MAWNEQESKKRVDNNDFHDLDVNVADLSRKMDFANLGKKDVRRADAAHLYADIPNFHLAVTDAGADKEKQKKLIRAASVLRKVQTDLLKSSDLIGNQELGRIQLQAARLHALCYKPYDDEAKRARNAVVMGISLNTYIYDVFNPAFTDVRNFQSAIGISAGKCLIANPGIHGERERICLGTPANLAAKVLGLGNTITITSEVYDLIPEDLQAEFSKAGEVAGAQTYKSKVRWDTHPDLATSLGVTWDREKWEDKTVEHRDALTLKSMEVRWAETELDLDSLTERNSRRMDAVAIYADLDGFTQYVEDAEKDDAVVSLVRELHMIRHEFHAVLKRDYPGVVLQHQGDRVFAILHKPYEDNDTDHGKRCRSALDAAIGIQSSMQHVLREKLPDRKNLYVAVGLDVGTALVTRLGQKGKRVIVGFGPEVCGAEKLQLKSAAKEIRISKAIYEKLERKAIKDSFAKSGSEYVAVELTFPKIEEEEATTAAKSGRLTGAVQGSSVHVVTSSSNQSRPWSAS